MFGGKARLSGVWVDDDYVARYAAAHPDTLIGFLSVDPTQPGWERELEDGHRRLGLRGVKLLPMYAGFAQATGGDSGAGILELACGTGRCLLPLAGAGHTVTGLDVSPAMLAQLRKAGVEVDDKLEEQEFGRFGWAVDPEGIRFELWEPSTS